MTHITTRPWEAKRTGETRKVEQVLTDAGFKTVDAYRYNSASIRVRVIDKQFEGMPTEKRDAIVEPYLANLPEQTQADIINLFTFAPSELIQTPKTLRAFLMNTEFEEPSPSRL